MVNLEDRLKYAAEYVYQILKLFAPKDTGNLSTNAIRIVNVSPSEWNIVIGGELAPYAIFTNEQWVSPRWKGKSNPNQSWVQNALESATPMVQTIMSGAISENDLNDSIKSKQDAFDKQLFQLTKKK